jgi:hypothetical protein
VVAELATDSDAPNAFGTADKQFLEQVATVIAPYCLVGWDTGGAAWDAPENWEE